MKLTINGCIKEVKPITVTLKNTKNSRRYRAEIILEGNILSDYDMEKFEDKIKEMLKQD